MTEIEILIREYGTAVLCEGRDDLPRQIKRILDQVTPPEGTALIPAPDVTRMAETRGRREGEIWRFDTLGLSLLINDISNAVVKNLGK